MSLIIQLFIAALLGAISGYGRLGRDVVCPYALIGMTGTIYMSIFPQTGVTPACVSADIAGMFLWSVAPLTAAILFLAAERRLDDCLNLSTACVAGASGILVGFDAIVAAFQLTGGVFLTNQIIHYMRHR